MKKKFYITICLTLILVILTACSNNNVKITSAKPVVDENSTVATTSIAIMQICEALEIDLVGVPDSNLYEIPDVYSDATVVGHPMSPDMEIVAQLDPDIILSPVTLISDLLPKYESSNIDYAFVNLKSVYGMFKSIEELGEMFGKEEKSEVLMKDFSDYYNSYKKKNEGEKGPKVLLLMGLPGSYVVATENSYAGSLVDLAGGVNVYSGTDQEFLNVNVEDMIQKDPDIILRTAHALPEDVMKMFAEEFKTNDIWSHFRAVKENKVYDLPHEYFGMSANFDYAKGLDVLDELLYGGVNE